jgi:hypothetical protein
LKNYKYSGSDQIPEELIQSAGETFVSAIQKLINYIWNMEELLYNWKESIIVPIHKRVIKLAVMIFMGYHCYQLHTKLY